MKCNIHKFIYFLLNLILLISNCICNSNEKRFLEKGIDLQALNSMNGGMTNMSKFYI